MAERAAQRVRGVVAVVDNLEVRLPPAHERLDADLVGTASDSLRWNTLVPHELISVSATHGRITLRGEIPHQYQRQAAENAVQYPVGVKSLDNEITVTPPVVPGDVIGLIEKALVRNAEADARNIQVAADGGKVTLSGKVHSWAERAEVARAAWKAPGLREVLNDLVVDA